MLFKKNYDCLKEFQFGPKTMEILVCQEWFTLKYFVCIYNNSWLTEQEF